MAKNNKQTKARVSVPLSMDIMNRLDVLAEQYGLSRSTMASFLIADSINLREKSDLMIAQGTDVLLETLLNQDD